MAIWRGLKSFGARDFSPENSSDEGLKSLAPTKKNNCPPNSHLPRSRPAMMNATGPAIPPTHLIQTTNMNKKFILDLHFQNSVVYSLPNYWAILPGIIQNNHQNTDNHYEEDCYHRPYGRRFRFLPAAAAAAGDPRGCSRSRGAR